MVAFTCLHRLVRYSTHAVLFNVGSVVVDFVVPESRRLAVGLSTLCRSLFGAHIEFSRLYLGFTGAGRCHILFARVQNNDDAIFEYEFALP